MTTKANCPDAFTEDEPNDATFCDQCSYTSTPDEFIHVGDKDLCRDCVARASTTAQARAQYEATVEAARDAHDRYVTACALPVRERYAAYKQWQLAIEARRSAADDLLLRGYADLAQQ
jgi:ribosomal protein L40E